MEWTLGQMANGAILLLLSFSASLFLGLVGVGVEKRRNKEVLNQSGFTTMNVAIPF